MSETRNTTEALVGNRAGEVFTERVRWIHARVWHRDIGGYADPVKVEIPESIEAPFHLNERIEVEGYGPERRFYRKLPSMNS